MNKVPVIFFVFLLLGLQACSNRPREVLSDAKMEDVLYDIHIADAEIENDNQTFSRYGLHNLKKQQLYNAVFEKHGITSQTFDTSLVWYSGNLTRFVKIYDRVGERYTLLSGKLNEEKNRQEESLRSGIYAVNRWKGKSAVQLSPYSIEEHKFFIQANALDSLQASGCELQFNALGITPETQVKVLFCVNVKDTFLMVEKRVEFNGNNLISLNADSVSNKIIKSAWGLMQLEQGDNSVIIHNIKLRMVKR